MKIKRNIPLYILTIHHNICKVIYFFDMQINSDLISGFIECTIYRNKPIMKFNNLCLCTSMFMLKIVKTFENRKYFVKNIIIIMKIVCLSLER